MYIILTITIFCIFIIVSILFMTGKEKRNENMLKKIIEKSYYTENVKNIHIDWEVAKRYALTHGAKMNSKYDNEKSIYFTTLVDDEVISVLFREDQRTKMTNVYTSYTDDIQERMQRLTQKYLANTR